MNLQRFKDDFCNIAQFGCLNNGGVTRLAFSKEDQDARNYLIRQMQQAKLTVTVDSIGNIRGVRSGSNASLAPVMLGSHLDTVPHGGHYDGVLGVLAALEVVRSLDDAEIVTERAVEVINFSAEESSRFGMATIGSKAVTGKLAIEDLKDLTDENGNDLYTILINGGYDIKQLPTCVLQPGDIHAFLELHIEQGPILEHGQLDVGIVTAIAAPSRFKIQINGRNDHSGTTPMNMRRDALIGAAEIVLGVEKLALQSGGDSVATVGVLQVDHAAMNIVPGEVTLNVDIRDTNTANKQQMVVALQQLLQQVARCRQLDIVSNTICDDQPIILDKNIGQQIADQAQNLGLHWKMMPSGAGHDAMHMANIAPTGLIFIPSIGGISHNIAEKSSIDAIEKGIQLLYATVLQLADNT